MNNFLDWAYRFFIGPFEEKRDGLRRGSMGRWAIWLFTLGYCHRLLTIDVLGWPDAVVAFCVLFALPIGKALDRAPPEVVVESVTGMFGRGGHHSVRPTPAPALPPLDEPPNEYSENPPGGDT